MATEKHVSNTGHRNRTNSINIDSCVDMHVSDSEVDSSKLKFTISVSHSPELMSNAGDDASRETWTGRLDFLLSCVGFAVGLGNIWRFPYLCYKSGGGAFLIPYLFFMASCGLPLFYLEVSIGQFSSLSPIEIWRISPLFEGLGYGMVIISAIVCIYYNVIMAWNFYFLYMTMGSVLPWTLCGQKWNTRACITGNNTVVHGNQTTYSVRGVRSSLEFWEHNVLEMTDGIENFGTVRWPLLWCLLLAWLVVFVCLIKGIKSSGKVVYVTATIPYVVLTILLVRMVTLPGSRQGIEFYVIPKWSKLLDVRVWGDAAVQIFYSVGMSWGSIITMASYNKFNYNVFKDAMLVPLINCGTSIFAGFVIFSTLGFMANQARVPIENVVSQGPGLTFVAYPEAVSKMPLSQLWAVLFFLMIFTIGIDSQFGMFESVTCAFIDKYPRFLRQRKVVITASLCIIEFLLGIPLVFQGGIYLLQIIDWYSATFSLMLISIMECTVISWIYGVDRFGKDIALMMGGPPSIGWKIMWKYITPTLVMLTWVFSVYTLEPVSIKNYKFPLWAICFGWVLGAVSLIPLPLHALILIKLERTGTLCQRLKKLAQPAYNWGPALEKNQQGYIRSMSLRERERHESSFFMVDVERYLKVRQLDSCGHITRVDLEHISDPIAIQQFIVSPDMSDYFSKIRRHSKYGSSFVEK